MALPPDKEPTQSLPALPLELLIGIMDEAYETLDGSVTSAIALTSHTFRSIINKRRFSSLVLHREGGLDVRYTSKMVKTLADIIRSGQSIDTMPGVCKFATSFSLKMIGYYDEVAPVLEDGWLAYIFDHLFRPSSLFTASNDRSLFLYIYCWCRDEEDYYSDDQDRPRYNGLSWRSMDPKLSTALEDLIMHSELNQLSLQELQHVPSDLLRDSNIKDLRLHRTTLSEADWGDNHPNYLEMGPMKLEFLAIDAFISVADLERITYPISRTPYLVHFSIRVPFSDMIGVINHVLARSPALQSLDIFLWITENDYRSTQQSFSINYSQLAHLTCLSITIRGETSLPLITQLLVHNIPMSLRDLSIVFLIEWIPRHAVSNHLASLNISTLDKHLAHPSFDSVQSIQIIVEYMEHTMRHETNRRLKDSSYLVDWPDYIKSQVPRLLERRPELDAHARWGDTVGFSFSQFRHF